jgi:hypothetical protein
MERNSADPAATFRARYIDALEQRHVDPRCNVCGTLNWEPAFDAGLRLAKEQGLSGEGPLVTGATCMTCGTVRLIDTHVLWG